MAATALRTLLLIAVISICATARADDSADVHKVIGALADALSSGDAAEAMSYFSKQYANYAKLSDDFDALTGAYYVENRLEFPDEQDSDTEATVTVRWDLALTTRQTQFVTNRTAELQLKLVHEGRKWRISEFGPTTIFDPEDR